MPAILRIDVDKPFLRKKSFTNNLSFKRKLDQRNLTDEFCFSFSTGFLFVKKKKCMIKDLNNQGIKASLFFQPFTVPNKDFAQELIKERHSIGLHAVHTKDYKNFSRDLNKISKRFDDRVYGFTKHGSVTTYDNSEGLSGYMNTGFMINDALRGIRLWKYFL